MPLTIIKEDGTGKPDANSYATAADGDTYHEGHLHAGPWTSATLPTKEKALVFATRLIDSQYQFNGWRSHADQALQFPRDGCVDPDSVVSVWGLRNDQWLPTDVVPTPVVNATCELARELLLADRTAAPAGEGIDSLFDGTTTVKYNKSDTRPIISYVAQAMLSKFGAPLSRRTATVRLLRA